MALPVLDGNQSATTLSSVVTGGEHIVAHSVVSLGANAIANITSAVSGSVVSISNFPASQSTTFGAVTGSVSILNFPSTQTIAGTVTANVNLISDQAGGNSPVVFGVPGADVNTIRTVIYSSANSSFGNDQGAPVDSENPLPVCGTVTVSNAVELANALIDQTAGYGSLDVNIGGYGGGLIFPISGTVTASNLPIIQETLTSQNAVVVAGVGTVDNQVPVQLAFVDTDGNPGSKLAQWIRDGGGDVPISGTVTANVDQVSLTNALDYFAVNYSEAFPVSLQSEISGTVTAAAPNGSLTTRFGTPTTANVSFATSAVTNANRKYLLIQNVTTGSNVITVGIGFTPTTTQGIQLTAGAGITFESSYIPTGAVQILSSVTASNFTILEA